MDILSNLCDPAQVAAIIGGIYLVKVFYSASSQLKTRTTLLYIMVALLILVLGVITVINYSCDSITNYIAWGLVGLAAVYLVSRLMRK